MNIPTKGRPVRLVVLDSGSGAPLLIVVEEIPADDAEIVDQLFQAARSVESRMRGLSVDRVVVRRADVPTQASKKDGPRLRLLIEGAVVGAARSAVTDTRLGMGKDVAHWHGTLKDDLDDEAKVMLAGAGKQMKFAEAACAALAGLALP